MKIKEAIKQLQAIYEEHGNIPLSKISYFDGTEGGVEDTEGLNFEVIDLASFKSAILR